MVTANNFLTHFLVLILKYLFEPDFDFLASGVGNTSNILLNTGI